MNLSNFHFIHRNQFYGGEFSSHTLTNLISWSDNIKYAKREIIDTCSVDEDQTTAEVECNNDLNNYYFDFNYEWTQYSLDDDEKYIYDLVLLK